MLYASQVRGNGKLFSCSQETKSTPEPVPKEREKQKKKCLWSQPLPLHSRIVKQVRIFVIKSLIELLSSRYSKSQHVLQSTLLRSLWQLVHPPSIAEQHRSQEGRQGWVLQEGLGSRAGLCGFAGQETNCLQVIVSPFESTKNPSDHGKYLLFKTSKQIRPRRSIFG